MVFILLHTVIVCDRYQLTPVIEERKNKKQSQKETLEQVLIPYCSRLEERNIKIKGIYQNPPMLYQNNNFTEWMNPRIQI